MLKWFTTLKTNATAAGLILALGVALGLTAGWTLWKPKPQTPETYAAAVKQKDGSVILERKPDATAQPAQPIPAGAKVERVVQVTVQPRAVVPTTGPSAEETGRTSGPVLEAAVTNREPLALNLAPGTPCPPVRVDLTLIRLKDQSHRVVASSPDGEVVGGVDVPVESAAPPRALPWAAGGIYGVSANGGRSIGAFLHRDWAFVRAGAEVTRDTTTGPVPTTAWSARVLMGIRF